MICLLSEMARVWFHWLSHRKTRFRGSAKCWPMNLERLPTSNHESIDSQFSVRLHQYSTDWNSTPKVVETFSKTKFSYLIVLILSSVPTNGLVIYCGTIVTEEGKEKKVNIDFEPFKPINTSLYLCDNKVIFLDQSQLYVLLTFCSI